MKEKDQELLSRILDEDASEFETKRILKEIKSSSEHQDTLKRYSLIGHAIRNELPPRINLNFTNEVMNKIENDDTQEVSITEIVHESSSSNKIKTVVGFAIAASVAIFSFVTIQDFMQPKSVSDEVPAFAERVIEESDIQRVSAEELQNFFTNPDAAAEFNSYIVNHAEHASPRASMPHVRIVGYGQEQE